MKQFRSKTKTFNRKKAYSVSRRAALGVVGIFVFLSIVAPQATSSVFHALGAPLWSFKAQVIDRSILVSVVSFFKEKAVLQSENNELHEEIKNLKSNLVDNNIIREENKILRDALNMRPANEDSVFAYVLVRPDKTPYDTFILGAGIGNNIRVGDSIRVGENQTIGEITRVHGNTSVGQLFSTPGISSEVVLSEVLSATAVGVGNGSYKIELPRDITVSEGMSVRMSRSPRTLLGFVESVEKDATDSFQKILVRSTVNIQQVHHVFIVHTSQ